MPRLRVFSAVLAGTPSFNRPVVNRYSPEELMALDQDLQLLVANGDASLVLQAEQVQVGRDNNKALSGMKAVPISEAELKCRLVAAIAVNYMKPSTATTPDGIQNDVTRDADWVKAASEAVWSKCGAFIKAV